MTQQVEQTILEQVATHSNFDESEYLASNPDVAFAVRNGQMPSGFFHFKTFGFQENRKIRKTSLMRELKQRKMSRIKQLLREDLFFSEKENYYNFLSSELRRKFKIVDTDAVSSFGYDHHGINLINKYWDGILLDCGAGKRPIYFGNVVNLEIVPYDTTDVLAVGEVLPFQDNVFDAVISVAVLEHVNDPFKCAKEIIRVLKPGGELFCAVPFLQPLHGYPHHYYNMSHQGLRNLFEDSLEILKQDVYGSLLPIWSLTWFLKSWVEGLDGATRKEFLRKTVEDLIQDPEILMHSKFVTELPLEKNFELASGTALLARKPY